MYVIASVLILFILLVYVFFFAHIYIVLEFNDFFKLSLKFLFINIKIIPKENKIKKAGKEQKESQSANEEKHVKEKKKPDLDKITKLIDLIKYILNESINFIGNNCSIIIERYIIKVGGNEAANVAVNYGIVLQSSQFIYDILEYNNKIKCKSDAEAYITPDFIYNKWNANIKISVCTNNISSIIKLINKIIIKWKSNKLED